MNIYAFLNFLEDLSDLPEQDRCYPYLFYSENRMLHLLDHMVQPFKLVSDKHGTKSAPNESSGQQTSGKFRLGKGYGQ